MKSLAALALVLALSVPAAAVNYEVITRSAQNLIGSPMDLVLSPITAGTSIYNSIGDSDDSTLVKAVYVVPGYFWNMMVQFGAGVIRGMTGLIELIPGLVLLPTDAELDPLFSPAEDNEALVQYEGDYFILKGGVDYTSTY